MDPGFLKKKKKKKQEKEDQSVFLSHSLHALWETFIHKYSRHHLALGMAMSKTSKYQLLALQL